MINKSKIEQFIITPKSIVINKVINKLGTNSLNNYNRNEDNNNSTYKKYNINFDFNSLNIIEAIHKNNYTIKNVHKESIANLMIENVSQNKFDLLGSGLIEVTHSCDNYSYENVSFNHSINYKSKEDYVKKYINLKNQDKSLEIMNLIPNKYNLIDWQRDFRTGFRWAENTWYKDVKYGIIKGAEIKIPWELGRMQWLPMLAINYVNSEYESKQKEKILNLILNQIIDFIASNPPRYGCQWMTSMDVAIRAVNWIVTLDILSTKVNIPLQYKEIIVNSIYEHLHHIYNNMEFSEGQRGNHYLSNIVGMYVISYFLNDENLLHIRHYSKIEIFNEIDYQFNKDGSNFEASLHYHILSFELLSFALNYIDKKIIYNDLQKKINKIKEFTDAVLHLDKTIFQIGDNDSGRLLKLNYISSIYYNDILFHDYKYNKNYLKLFNDVGIIISNQQNYNFILKNGTVGQYGKGGHAHNDNLSFCLKVKNTPVIVDPGTYNYTSFPSLRDKYRYAKSHNGIIKKNIEPNLIIEGNKDDLFWLYDKSSPILDLNNYIITASHTGYGKKAVREIQLNDNYIIFNDSLQGEFTLRYHFHPKCNIIKSEKNILVSVNNINLIEMIFDFNNILNTKFNHENIIIEDYYYSESYGNKELAKYIEINCTDELKWKINIINIIN